jgi:hypothetical protein
MENRQLLGSLLVCIFVAGLAFAALPSSYAQNNSIFGYPYYTTQAGGSGAKYDVHGSLFTLNGPADINSMSCLMDGGFSPTEPNDRYIYRYAIYTDNNGKVGGFIGQTETATFTGKPGGSNDGQLPSDPAPERRLILASGCTQCKPIHHHPQRIPRG